MYHYVIYISFSKYLCVNWHGKFNGVHEEWHGELNTRWFLEEW